MAEWGSRAEGEVDAPGVMYPWNSPKVVHMLHKYAYRRQNTMPYRLSPGSKKIAETFVKGSFHPDCTVVF